MYNFASFYRAAFWVLIAMQVLVAAVYFLFHELGAMVLFILSLLSIIHFFGLIAVIFDTHRCARNNSIYLRRLTEILDPQAIERIGEPEETSTEELIDANERLSSE